MAGSCYQINWSKFQSNIATYLQSMLTKDFLTDVSLYSGNQTWKVHKVVLCANSGYFEQLLKGIGVQHHPVLVLDHIHPEYISYLLEYMYTGNINIEHDKVHKFIQMSKMLQIRGISTSSQNIGPHSQENNSYSEQNSQSLSDASNPTQNHPRSVKRRRLSSERNKSSKCETDNRQNNQNLDHTNSSMEDDTVVIKTEPFLQVGIVEDEDSQIEIKPDPDQIAEQSPKDNGDDNYYSDKTVNRESDEETMSNITPSLSVRSDLLHVTGNINTGSSASGTSSKQIASEPAKIIKKWSSDMDRCHFCSVHCGNQEALTVHLKTVHMPPKHALCENCENFFHVCAIVRHRAKCHQKLAQFSTLSSLL